MGLTILPPNVNGSGLDFEIEEQAPHESIIRYGLGAIKNVGYSSVEAMLQARPEEGFVDLGDFVRRVDLRQVGKRAMESLIRVGALDELGARLDLLESLDRIMSYSATHFRAAEVGQLSIFGESTGVAEQLVVKPAAVDVSWRRQLSWEKELLGSYVSDHPLAAKMDELSSIVTHYSGEISESMEGEKVTVAGEICAIRPYLTRAGKEMGFLSLEDLQGTIELVVFQRLWEKISSDIELNQIVVVNGRVDGNRGEPKLLVDSVDHDLDKISRSTGDAANHDEGETAHAVHSGSDSSPRAAPQHSNQLEQVARVGAGKGNGEIPDAEQPTHEPAAAPSIPKEPMDDAPGTLQAAEAPSISKEPELGGDTPGSLQVAEAPPAPVLGAPSGEPQFSQESLPDYLAVWQGPEPSRVTILLRSSGDRQRDIRRMRRIHVLLASYPGSDRFVFTVYEDAGRYDLAFPNSSTRYTPELYTKLLRLVGDNCVHVAPLHLH
jgi:DNA polymerase-3 subunit alpha